MTRRLLLGYLLLTAFVLLVLEVPLGTSFARSERDKLLNGMQKDALVLATFVEDRLERDVPQDLDVVVATYSRRTGARAIVVDRAGRLVADSDEPRAAARDFSTRPEIASALRGELVKGLRHSNTLGTDLAYVAAPVASGGGVFGAVRLTLPSSALGARIRRNWLALGLVAAIVLAAASIVGLVLARSMTRPLKRLEEAAGAVATGDLTARAAEEGPPELRKLAIAFNDMTVRLDELIDSQRAFVADASHQLRTPLTALRLRLENLEASASKASRPEIEGALREAMRLSHLVDGLLALARAEGANVERTDVAVDAVVRERREVWQPLAEERTIDLREEASARDAHALAAPGSLEQILDNLLANALEVAPPGSDITLRTQANDGWVEVHVVDRGPGMTEQQRLRAFERFWQADAARGDGGSGLGLAIVRRLARASGGDAELREAPTGGLDAFVRLPRAR